MYALKINLFYFHFVKFLNKGRSRKFEVKLKCFWGFLWEEFFLCVERKGLWRQSGEKIVALRDVIKISHEFPISEREKILIFLVDDRSS